MIETFGTAVCDEDKISAAVCACMDLSPAGIIEKFDLRRPIYAQIASYGHVGREDLDLPWEKRDLAAELLEYIGK